MDGEKDVKGKRGKGKEAWGNSVGLTRILGERSKSIRTDGDQFRNHELALFNTEHPDKHICGLP